MKENFLNFCRQIRASFEPKLKGAIDSDLARLLRLAVDAAQRSEKFFLPVGGRLFDDPELRSIDDSEELRLPFPQIALEYMRHSFPVGDGSIHCSKVVIFAQETDFGIELLPVNWATDYRAWWPMPPIGIPKTEFFRRDLSVEGRPAIIVVGDIAPYKLTDYDDEVGALLQFLNVLRCSNVQVSHAKSAAKNNRCAHKFDSYRVLVIGGGQTGSVGSHIGTGRSPREHLRRGHIRRLSDGRRVWVNSTVVAAGKGAGKVHKSYSLTKNHLQNNLGEA